VFVALAATFVFRTWTFVREACGWTMEGQPQRWYRPCLAHRVPEATKPLVYDQPTVMWRMRRADGMSSHAVITPRATGAVVVWFLNNHPLGSRDFSDWTGALRWSDQLQAQNWSVGWRLD
jgi:hypothetical protein